VQIDRTIKEEWLMSIACPKCQSTDLSKLKRNSFENNPGYICNTCHAKLRDPSTTKILYAYIVLGTIFVLANLVLNHGREWWIVGVVPIAYATFKLVRRPVVLVSTQ
jgi:DNA-directed RNA polymerase subunit RPC12/RpoP